MNYHTRGRIGAYLSRPYIYMYFFYKSLYKNILKRRKMYEMNIDLLQQCNNLKTFNSYNFNLNNYQAQ